MDAAEQNEDDELAPSDGVERALLLMRTEHGDVLNHSDCVRLADAIEALIERKIAQHLQPPEGR